MLRGERVLLRALRPDDVEPLWQMRQDRAFWAQTDGRPLLPRTLGEYRAQYEAPSTGDDAQFAVEVDGVLAGRCLVFEVDPLARHAEIGLSLLPEFRGRGLGRDVLRVLLDYGFRSRNLRRIHLQTLASNEPALRAYRAAGFVEEGRRREHAWVEGRYDDVVLMAVLRSEWSG